MKKEVFTLSLLIFCVINSLQAEGDIEKLNSRVSALEKQVSELREIIEKISSSRGVETKQELANRSLTKATFGSVIRAIKLFQLKRRRFPVDLEELTKNRFLTKQPLDGWGNELIYILKTDKKSIEIISYGADKKEGGAQEDEDLKLVFP